MSLIPADNIPALGSVIFALACLGFWADSHRIARRLSGVVFVIVGGVILSNIGFTPLSSPVYDFTGKYLVPLAIPLLLFKANLRNIVKEGGMVLPIFLLGGLGICVGAVLGYFLFDLGEAGKKIAGIYTGAWIGGVANFVAIAQALELDAEQFSIALSASSPVSVLGLLALVTLPSMAFIMRRIPSKIIAETPMEARTADDSDAAPRFRTKHITSGLAISFAICAVSNYIAARLGIANYSIFVITVVTAILANVFPKFFAAFEGDFILGMLIMYLFFAVVGCSTDALTFIYLAPIYFVYGAFIIATHLVFILLCARVFKFDLAETIVASAAAIVGAAPAAAIASSNGWKNLITPGITMGVLGYVIANFIGIALYNALNF